MPTQTVDQPDTATISLSRADLALLRSTLQTAADQADQHATSIADRLANFAYGIDTGNPQSRGAAAERLMYRHQANAAALRELLAKLG